MKRLTNIFFLMGTSRSMHGEIIDAVNAAMYDGIIPIIKESAARYDGRKIQCSILEFNDEVNWILEAVAAEELQWIDLEADGGTMLGAAYMQLLSKLSRNQGGLMAQHMNTPPIIILFSDGQSIDDADTALAFLKRNQWFNCAFKYALKLPGNGDRQKLIDFTGTEELILNPEELIRELKTGLERCLISWS